MEPEEMDLAAIERGMVIANRFRDGERLTSADVARICDVTIRHARNILNYAARVMPVAVDDDGVWYWMGEE